MHKEYINARIASIKKMLDENEQMVLKATANANACAGAIQELERFLKIIEESEAKSKENAEGEE